MPPNRTTRTRPAEHLSPSTSPRRVPRSSDVRPDSYRLSTTTTASEDYVLVASANHHESLQNGPHTRPVNRPQSISARIAQSWNDLQASTQTRQSAPPSQVAHRQQPDRPHHPRYSVGGPSASYLLNARPQHALASRPTIATGASSSPSSTDAYTAALEDLAARTADVFGGFDESESKQPLLTRLKGKVSTRQKGHSKAKAENKAAQLALARLQLDPRYEMSIFNPSSSLLQAKVEVVFENDGKVDMLGGINTGSNYSLPGHITVSLPASSKRILRELREVKLVVESMADWADDTGKYTPLRVFAQTYVFACTHNPIAFPNYDQQRPYDARVKLAIPFDLRLPGWLPPSLVTVMSRVAHGCQASVVVGWMDRVNPPNAHPFASAIASMHAEAWDRERAVVVEAAGSTAMSRSSLTSKLPFGSSNLFGSSLPAPQVRSAATAMIKSKYTPFDVRRHCLPRALALGPRVPRILTIRPKMGDQSPIEIIMSVPEWVDAHGDARSLKVQLMIRANAAAFQEQLAIRARAEREKREWEERLISDEILGEDIQDAVDRIYGESSYRNPSGSGSMPGSFESSRSIDKLADAAPASVQRSASLAANCLTYVRELGMEVEETERYSSKPLQAWTQAVPIPAEQPDRTNTVNPLINPEAGYDGTLDPDFGKNGRALRYHNRRKCLLAEDGSQRNFFFQDKGLALDVKWRKVNVVLPMPTSSNSYNRRPQSEVDSPFVRIVHVLKLRLECANADDDSGSISTVDINAPIRFGTQPSTFPGFDPKRPVIPPYVQLFYENGDQRECDALPIYRESCENDQPPPFSPVTPIAQPAEVQAPPVPVSTPSPPPLSDDLPAPGETLTTGDVNSRSPSPSPPSSEQSEDEDDPMDGSYQSDVPIATSAPATPLRSAPLPPITSSPARGRDATGLPPRARFPSSASRFQELRLPPPSQSMLSDVLSAGSRSPRTPRAYPYPTFAAAQAFQAPAGPSHAEDTSFGSDQMDVDESTVREPSADSERVPVTPSGRTATIKLYQPIPIRAPVISNNS